MTKSEINKALVRWRSRLWLNQWDIGVIYERLSGLTAACVEYRTEYKHATISIDLDKKITEPVIIHELCHLLIAGSLDVGQFLAKSDSEKEWARQSMESTVSHLTRVFCEGANMDLDGNPLRVERKRVIKKTKRK